MNTIWHGGGAYKNRKYSAGGGGGVPSVGTYNVNISDGAGGWIESYLRALDSLGREFTLQDANNSTDFEPNGIITESFQSVTDYVRTRISSGGFEQQYQNGETFSQLNFNIDFLNLARAKLYDNLGALKRLSLAPAVLDDEAITKGQLSSLVPIVVNGKVDLSQIQVMTETNLQPTTGDYKGAWGLATISYTATKLQFCIDTYNGNMSYKFAIWESDGVNNSQSAKLIDKGTFTASANGLQTMTVNAPIVKGKYYTAILSLGTGTGGVSNFVGLAPKTNNGIAYGFNAPNSDSLPIGTVRTLNGDAGAKRFWFSLES